jgi:heme exporter protein D
VSDFLHMGGYAPYVWTAYGITLVVIVVNAWLAVRGHARSLARVRQMSSAQPNERTPTVRINP